jgi:hypothetical protein
VRTVCHSVGCAMGSLPLRERGETSGVSKVFLRIARKSILFEQKT